MGLSFKWTQGKEDAVFADASKVRIRVFVDEQGYDPKQDIDSNDAVSLHLVGYEDKMPVCTARIFDEGEGVWHIGRVAVLKQCRGKKYGQTLIKMLVEKACTQNAKEVILNSQADKTAFYESVGFAETGEANIEEGQPHMWMRRVL